MRYGALPVLLAFVLAGCKKPPAPSARGADLARTEAGATGTVDSAAMTATRSGAPAPAAPSSEPVGPPKILTYTLTDDTIIGPDSLATGAFEVRVTNRARTVQELRFLRLPPNARIEAALEYLRQSGEIPPGLGPQGGVGPLAPGRSLTVVQTFRPGSYLLMSTLTDKDGKGWFTKGMLLPMVITGNAPNRVQPPSMRAVAVMLTSDNVWRFGRTLTRGEDRNLLLESRSRRTDIPSGQTTIMLDHLGAAGHDLIILRAAEPGAMREYAAWLDGSRLEPPTIIGGVPGLYSQMRAFIQLRLEPGPYIIFCPNFRPGSNEIRGFQLGEYDQFVVK